MLLFVSWGVKEKSDYTMHMSTRFSKNPGVHIHKALELLTL